MSEMVQAFDPNNGDYVAIDVATGKFVKRSPRPFENLDEVEALERIQPERQAPVDPLARYR